MSKIVRPVAVRPVSVYLHGTDEDARDLPNTSNFNKTLVFRYFEKMTRGQRISEEERKRRKREKE